MHSIRDCKKHAARFDDSPVNTGGWSLNHLELRDVIGESIP
jgi:hypothetical protein